MTDQLHLVLQPVQAERAEDFERFVSEVVTPAVQAQRPDLEQRWRVMRSAETTDGVVTFAFLLEGGSLEEDWELNRLLPAHYGEEETRRLVGEWAETFAPLGPWAAAAVSAGRESDQVVWTLDPVTRT
ncbi:hypothetical protein [Nocardioides sp. P5_C9_2]